MESVYSIAVSVVLGIFSILFGMVAAKLWGLPKMIDKRLAEFSKQLDSRLQRIDEESKLSHRRIAVHDRIVSKVIDKDFDSRSVAESGIFPEFKGRLN